MAKREKSAAKVELTDSFRARLVKHAMGEKGLASIGREMAYGLADIRQKVVEEGMYGKAVTPPIEVGIHGREAAGDERDPLGRSRSDGPFRERCREAFAARERDIPEQPAQSPER